jgi:hypothetical protein
METPGIFFYLAGLFNGHQTKPHKGAYKSTLRTSAVLCVSAVLVLVPKFTAETQRTAEVR